MFRAPPSDWLPVRVSVGSEFESLAGHFKKYKLYKHLQIVWLSLTWEVTVLSQP